jgi:hypothetical protein
VKNKKYKVPLSKELGWDLRTWGDVLQFVSRQCLNDERFEDIEEAIRRGRAEFAKSKAETAKREAEKSGG